MMVRINHDVRPPLAFQHRKFARETSRTNRVAIPAARHGFMMHQPRPRLVERLPTQLVKTHAQVDVVESHRKILLIKPARFQKSVTLDYQAGSRHRRYILR